MIKLGKVKLENYQAIAAVAVIVFVITLVTYSIKDKIAERQSNEDIQTINKVFPKEPKGLRVKP